MRELTLTILFPIAFIWAIVSAPASVLVLNWIWFQRPYDFSWGMWNSMPMFQVAVLVALASNLFRGSFKLHFPGILIIYLMLMVWITLSAILAFHPQRAMNFYSIFAPSMWVGPILMFATIHDLKLLKGVLWVAVGGLGFNGFKTGVMLSLKGGAHLTDQITGFVGDNNVFGLVLCLVVAMLVGLRSTLPNRKWIRYGFIVFIAFVVVCIVFTKSRGALVSLAIILLTSSLLSGHRIRNLLLSAMLIGVTIYVIPPEYFERLSTLKNVSADESAMGRVENWKLSWDEAVDHPVFGVGPDNHIPYNRAKQPNVQVRAAHSVYFQTLGELGFPGLLLYLTFVFTGLIMLWRTWRSMRTIANEHPDLVWVRDLAYWTLCGYVGYSIGAGLLNMLYIEFPWYAIFYSSMLMPLVRRELAQREGTPVSTGQQEPKQIRMFGGVRISNVS